MVDELLKVLLSLAIVAGIIVLVFGYQAFKKTEFAVRNKANLEFLEKFLKGAIIQVADETMKDVNGEQMAKYEQKSADWEEKYGVYRDPRMWAVLDKVENSVLNGAFDLDFVVTVAEGIYQTLRKDPRNGLVLNPNDVGAIAEEGDSAEVEAVIEIGEPVEVN